MEQEPEARSTVERAVHDAIERERRRMADDLHDTLAHLAFITAQATWLANRAGEPSGPLADMAEAAGRAVGEVRRVIRDLAEPPDLADRVPVDLGCGAAR